jgi:hypothetical protein
MRTGGAFVLGAIIGRSRRVAVGTGDRGVTWRRSLAGCARRLRGVFGRLRRKLGKCWTAAERPSVGLTHSCRTPRRMSASFPGRAGSDAPRHQQLEEHSQERGARREIRDARRYRPDHSRRARPGLPGHDVHDARARRSLIWDRSPPRSTRNGACPCLPSSAFWHWPVAWCWWSLEHERRPGDRRRGRPAVTRGHTRRPAVITEEWT